MNERKNIDRLFQEKFKDFDVAPPDFIWENIEAGLQEKKKRRVVPLWVRLSGVAAILAIGTVISVPYINNDSNNSNGTNVNNTVVLETKNSKSTIDAPPATDPVNAKSTVGNASSNTAVALGDNEASLDNRTQEKKGTATGTSHANNNAVAYERRENNNYKQQTSSTQKNNLRQAKSIIIHEETVAENHKDQGSKHHKAGNAPADNDITNRNNHTKVIDYNKATGNSQESIAAAGDIKPGNSRSGSNSIVTTTPEQGITDKGTIVDTEKYKTDDEPIQVIVPQEIKQQEAVAQIESTVDTSATALADNELEKMLQKKLNDEGKEKKLLATSQDKNRWNIKPQMAPLFHNTMSAGSPIDAGLANNSKSFDNDLSVGIGLDYALTDRLTLRSGINTVNMKYSTNNIEFYASISDQTANVSGTGPSASLVVTPQEGSATGTQMAVETFSGAMVQKMGFIEVPLELSYSVLDKKFGIDLIGGFSTLFLNNNNVSVVTNRGLSSDMGEATNLNNVHFSTNVGLGFRYRFLRAFEASFEPMFKYQVNTFSSNDGNFKPYFIGLYTGVSFSF